MIRYIGPYVSENYEREKFFQPSARNKMNYILFVFAELKENVSVFSTVAGRRDLSYFSSEKREIVGHEIEVIYPSTMCGGKILDKVIARLLLLWNLFQFWISTNKEDIIVVYHSLSYATFIRLLYKLFPRTVVYEIEEVYAAVYCSGEQEINKELKLIDRYNGYVVVNNYLQNIFTNSAVCLGTYTMKETKTQHRMNNGIIYSGVIEGKGSDADVAIDMMQFLDGDYHLTIIGYGTEDDILYLKNKIEMINQKLGKETITYKGFLSGLELDRELSLHRYGLCSRVLNNMSSNYTFPSKVLVYISLGLIPICSPLKILMTSELSSCLVYSEGNGAKDFAEAIRKAKLREINQDGIKDKIVGLHQSFVQNLKKMMNTLREKN